MYDSLFSSVDENASEEERIKEAVREFIAIVEGYCREVWNSSGRVKQPILKER